jgi:hypothetical protein
MNKPPDPVAACLPAPEGIHQPALRPHRRPGARHHRETSLPLTRAAGTQFTADPGPVPSLG